MAYDNSMKGTLGKNKRKEKDSHPDYSGSCEIDGVEYWISGWIKENGKTKERFFSLSFKEKDARTTQTPRPTGGIEDDDIPF